MRRNKIYRCQNAYCNAEVEGNSEAALKCSECSCETLMQTVRTVPVPKVAQVLGDPGSLLVLLDNGQLWQRDVRGWDRVPLPPPCEED